MPWFQSLCRSAGLMVHEIVKPVKRDPAAEVEKREVSRQVQEQRVNDRVTLRRTTIEEVEVTRDPDDA